MAPTSLASCLCHQLSLDLKVEKKIQGHESEKVSEIVSHIYLCPLYRRGAFDLKTPPCYVMIDCAILGWELISHKIQLKRLNSELLKSLFAQCPFSGADLEMSLEESCHFFASLRAVSSVFWRKRACWASIVSYKQRFSQCRHYDWILWYSMHEPNKRNLVFEKSVCGSRKNLVM